LAGLPSWRIFQEIQKRQKSLLQRQRNLTHIFLLPLVFLLKVYSFHQIRYHIIIAHISGLFRKLKHNIMKRSIRIFHWLPRVICILAILFISMFAADSFTPGHTIWQQIGAFLIHLIPSYILIAVLIMAWKWEKIGGIIFMVIGLGLSPFIFQHNYEMNQSVGMSLGIILAITFPFVIVGILFIVSHYIKKKNSS